MHVATLKALASICAGLATWNAAMANENDIIPLPEPRKEGKVSVEEAITNRRSRRQYKKAALTQQQIGQLLWSAQGITGDKGRKRSAPSAGATYPMDLYLVIDDKGTEGLSAGVYHYLPEKHSLKQIKNKDIHDDLSQAALGQKFIALAPVNLVLAADYKQTTGRYGSRGRRYVHMEAGHVSQNVYLQAEALGLSTVAVGAFDENKVSRLLGINAAMKVLYIMPVGK